MRKLRILFCFILVLLLCACAPALTETVSEEPAAPPPTTAPAQAEPPTAAPTEGIPPTSAPTEPASTEAVILDGKSLLETRCTSCHPLMMIELAQYPNANVWRGTVNDMVTRGATLNEEEKEVLISYLMKTYSMGAQVEGPTAAPAEQAAAPAEPELDPTEKLGMALFFDQNLSINRNQSCAICHGAEVGFVGPDEELNRHGAVYEGSIAGEFGNRKPPSAAYATFSPVLSQVEGEWIGGNFYDGRATGEKLGSPAADQAQGPFLNPKEQALPEGACVVLRVCTGEYGEEFKTLHPGACDISWPEEADNRCSLGELIPLDDANRQKAEAAYDSLALAITAYESSPLVNQFSSKFDLVQQGQAEFTDQEKLGFEIFQGKGQCTACHSSMGDRPLFTDFSYHNLGVPANPENPVYAYDPEFIDPGLGGYLQSADYDAAVYTPEMGKFKTATLRNVNARIQEEMVKAHMHNGYFKSLYGIVHYYNTRDILPTCPAGTTEAQALLKQCWPRPEYAENIDTTFMGNMGLSFDEEMAIVSFLKTLDDGYQP